MLKYIENTTAGAIFVGGKLIPPGEGREVEVPEPAAPAPETESTQPDAHAELAKLLDQAIGLIVPALPTLSDEDLQKLQEIETAAKARKGVLEAVQDLRLARADAAMALQEAQKALDAAKAKLEGLAATVKPADRAAAEDEVADAEAALAEAQALVDEYSPPQQE
ncbi:MAG TPA: hypothetical protein VD932_08655 [Aquabacterium sp.]|nr:hypothetical protein [Aquabacterium sp.]